MNTPARDSLLSGQFGVCLGVLAVACLPLGILWDTSWHLSIGRDTFWSPPHIAVYLRGVIPALLSAWQAAKTTFKGTSEERAASVRFWGGRASFGAWVTIWGALTMLTSAPFDDWWHSTYGLDVKILSVPHAVLGIGMFAVTLGVLLSVLSWQNRTVGDRPAPFLLFVLASGVMVTLLSFYVTEFTWPNQQHSAKFYQVISFFYPFLFVAIARASKLRWAATLATLIYMGLMMGLVWVLPFFPAQPKLAPIYNPVDHMVPPPFPMLMVVPALAIDLLMRVIGKAEIALVEAAGISKSDRRRWWKRGWARDWLRAIAVGTTFLILALAVQWFFAKFLLSPAADNWFFVGNRYWAYFTQPGEWRRQFFDLDTDPLTIGSLVWAVVVAVVSARFGLWCGNWLLKVKR